MPSKRQNYNLKEIYGKESAAQRYKRVTAGRYTGWFGLFLIEFIFGCFAWLPGLPGFICRKALYPVLFGRLPFSANVNKNVTFRAPGQIFISAGVSIDEYCQVQAISRNKKAIEIGENCTLHSFSILNAGEVEGYIRIGANSAVGQGSILYGNGGLTIGNNVLIAGQCFIVAGSHNYGTSALPISDQGLNARGITIEDGVWIGAGVKILDGVTIGKNSVIGSNAVVTRDIPPDSVAVGIPCRVIKKINATGDPHLEIDAASLASETPRFDA